MFPNKTTGTVTARGAGEDRLASTEYPLLALHCRLRLRRLQPRTVVLARGAEQAFQADVDSLWASLGIE